MAITDNLVSHIYAESGDSVPTDKIQSLALSGTGTATLTTVGGEDAWTLASFAQTVSVPTHNIDPTTTNTGVTFAARYRINTFGSTGGYNAIFGLNKSSTTKYLKLTKNASNVRTVWDGTVQNTLTDKQLSAVVHTIVCVCKSNTDGASAEKIETWVNQVSRANNDPDFVPSGLTASGIQGIDAIYIDAPDTMNYDLLDFVYWDRELTDAEAAAVADDLRTELPVGGGSDTTVNATLATISVSTYTATVVTSSATIVNATLGTIGVSAFDATIVTEASITIGPLKNNTASPWANQALDAVDVYSLTTGELVVRKTGLSTDGSGYCTFSDVALAASTEYKVTVTIGTDDGVKRHTAG